jgi:hypothetical protein
LISNKEEEERIKHADIRRKEREAWMSKGEADKSNQSSKKSSYFANEKKRRTKGAVKSFISAIKGMGVLFTVYNAKRTKPE